MEVCISFIWNDELYDLEKWSTRIKQFNNAFRVSRNYKKYEVKSKTEKGERFVAVNEDKPDVEGMVLVSENDNLKLYTNLETTEIAVYKQKWW